MISYRELAMRVVGKPLHVSGGKPGPAAHRVTALALTVAMVASLSAPAFAGWNIDMSKVTGDVTITKSQNKDDSTTTTIKVGNDTITVGGDNTTSGIAGVEYDSSTDSDNITVTGNNAGTSVDTGDNSQNSADNGGSDGQSGTSGDAVTQEGREDSAPVVADDTADEMTYTDPTPVETAPDVSEEEADPEAEADPEEKAAADPAPEEKTEAEGEAPAEGEQPAADVPATLEAPAAAGKSKDDDSKAVTYESNSLGQKVTAAFNDAVKHVLSIINRSNSELNVTLKNTTIDATGTDKDALTVSGSGDTKLTLVGDNTLTGGTGHTSGGSGIGQAGLNQTDGTLTITGDGTLTANGGSSGTGGTPTGGTGISTTGDLIISGGTVNANGYEGYHGGAGIKATQSGTVTIKGDDTHVNAKGGDCTLYFNGGAGIEAGSNGKVTISGGTVNATGGKNTYNGDNGNGNGGAGITSGTVEITGGTIENAQGGDNTKGSGAAGITGGNVTISGDAVIKNAQGGDGTTGGAGISTNNGEIKISGTADVTIKMSKDGHAITKDGTEVTDYKSVCANENERLTIYDANGDVVFSFKASKPTSDTPASTGTERSTVALSGFRFTNPFGGEITVHTEVKDGTVTFSTHHYGATMHTTLGALRQLRAQGVTQVTFQTLLHATTLTLDDVLAQHPDETDSTVVLLTHDGKKATLTVNGVER